MCKDTLTHWNMDVITLVRCLAIWTALYGHVICQTTQTASTKPFVAGTVPPYIGARPDRGPICFECRNVENPDHCHHLTICEPDEVCVLHGMAYSNTTQMRYYQQCTTRDLCQSAGHNSAAFDYHKGVLCYQCCDEDFCNHVCNLTLIPTPPSPGTALTSSVPSTSTHAHSSLMCYNCPLMYNPKHCQEHTWCQPGQVCMLRELGMAPSGMTEYSATCENEIVCSAFAHLPSLQGRRSSLCHSCCNTSLCNNDCDVTPATATPTTTTTTTPIPPTTAAVHGGLLCYNCPVMNGISECSHVEQCGQGKVCMLHELGISPAGIMEYRASCENEIVCNAFSHLPQLQGRRSTLCHACCNTPLCNKRCDVTLAPATPSPPLPPTTTTTPVPSTIAHATVVDGGLYCFNCPVMNSIDECRHLVRCDQGKVCMIRQSGESATGVKQYSSSCETKLVCDAFSHLIHGKKKRVVYCHRCCDTPLCNSHCSADLVTAPHTRPTLPSTTPVPQVILARCKDHGYGYVKHIPMCFKTHDEKKTHAEATQSCRSEGADLAVLDSETKMQFLNLYLQTKVNYINENIYMGAYDSYFNHTFYWPHSQKVRYAAWAPSEPSPGAYNRCTALRNGLWYSSVCYERHYFMCTKTV